MTGRESERIEQRGIKIEDAIQRAERITFTYNGEQRELSPHALREVRRGYRHRTNDTIRGADVVGWDHQRDAYRTFKLAKVRRIRHTGLPARELP